MSLKRFHTRNGVRFVVAAVVIAAVAIWLGFVVTSPSGGATVSAAQIRAAERTLVLVASADDPSTTAPAASAAAQIATRWPSNVTKVEYQLTDRGAAQVAMGTPHAVQGDARSVILFQLTGRFVARGVPEPPGSSSNTYNYAQFAVDASNATVLDVGFVDSPMTWPNSSAAVDIPVGSAVPAG